MRLQVLALFTIRPFRDGGKVLLLSDSCMTYHFSRGEGGSRVKENKQGRRQQLPPSCISPIISRHEMKRCTVWAVPGEHTLAGCLHTRNDPAWLSPVVAILLSATLLECLRDRKLTSFRNPCRTLCSATGGDCRFTVENEGKNTANFTIQPAARHRTYLLKNSQLLNVVTRECVYFLTKLMRDSSMDKGRTNTNHLSFLVR